MGNRRPPQTNDRGFTFLEVLVAISLLVIALMGLASVTVSVIKGNDLSKMVTSATTHARDKMEELRSAGATQTGFASIASGSDTVETVYARQWVVGAVGTTAPENDTTKMKGVVVTVNWSWNGHPHSVSLRTIIAKPS